MKRTSCGSTIKSYTYSTNNSIYKKQIQAKYVVKRKKKMVIYMLYTF